MNEWHKSNGPKPPVSHPIIICLADGQVGEGYYADKFAGHDIWKFNRNNWTLWDDEVTYWMNLPIAPE